MVEGQHRGVVTAWYKPWICASLLFGIAMAMQLAFLHATQDHAWPYSNYFKGDALVFVRQAGLGELMEGGVPLRPPGVAMLLGLVWDQTAAGFAQLRHLWCLFGALTAPLLYLVCRGPLGERVGRIAGGFVAIASGPLLIASALSNEAPYLLLALLSVAWLPRLRRQRTWLQFAAFGLVQGLACLLRAEHLVFLVCSLLWLLRRSPQPDDRRRWLPLGAALAAFGLVLLPWHLQAWEAITKVNTIEPQALRYSRHWSTAARQRVEAMPAFARFGTVRMLEDTVRVRGRREVGIDEFAILEQAYDYLPEPLSSHPFLSLYGPLNFYLANHPDSNGGFRRDPLFAAPPLRGGPQQYPTGLAQALPTQLELSYPPHLRIINHGYALGLAQIIAAPGQWLGLVGNKLSRFWAGAATGFGGYALPIGMSGIRHRVDVVCAEGWWAMAWRLLVFCAVSLGAAWNWRREELQPWLLWCAVRVLLTVLFFGYARHGILITPSIAVLVAVILDRLWTPWLARLCVATVIVVGGLELHRLFNPPRVFVDGIEIRAMDPHARSHADRRVEFR